MTVYWTPADLSTAPAMWFDASDASTFTITSGRVQEWRDKSGNDRHLSQSNSSLRPVREDNLVNGLGAVRWDATSRRLATTATINFNDFDVYVVFRDSGTDAYERLVDHSIGDGFYLMRHGTEVSSWVCGVMENSPPYGRIVSGLTDGQWGMLQSVRSGTQHSARANAGTAVTGTVTGSATLTNPVFVGGRSDESWPLRNGDIAEVIIVSAALSDTNRQKVEGYLAHKWGIESVLPSDHPYKESAPTLGPGVPDAPSELTATPGEGEVDLTWTAPADNGATITDYTVRHRATSGSVDWKTKTGVGGPVTISVPWTPALVPGGSALWLDASDESTFTIASGRVQEWRDKSGNNRHVMQSNSSLRPVREDDIVNGQGAVRWDSNNRVLATSSNISLNDFDLFVVFRDSGQAAYERLVDHDFANGFWLGRDNTTASTWRSGVRESSDPYGRAVSGLTDGEWHIIQSVRSGTQHTLRGNGGTGTSGTVSSTATTSNPIRIGAGNGERYLKSGDIAEVILVPAALSTDDRQRMEGYLAHRWALTGSLPPDHPYKTTAPTGSTTAIGETVRLSTGVSYDFQVAAVNSVGTGPFSSTVTATTLGDPTSGDAMISITAVAAAGTTFTPTGDAPLSVTATADGRTINRPTADAGIALTATAEASTVNEPTAQAVIQIAATAHVSLTQPANLAGVLTLTSTASASTRLPYRAAATVSIDATADARTLSRPDGSATITVTPGTTQASTYVRPTLAAIIGVTATAAATSTLPIRLTAEVTVTPGDAAARTLSRPGLPATITVTGEADASTISRPTAGTEITLIPDLLDPVFLFRPLLPASFRLATTVTADDGRTRPPNDGLPASDTGVWIRFEAEAHVSTVAPLALPPVGLLDPLADSDTPEDDDDAPAQAAAWVDGTDDEDDLAPGGWVLAEATDTNEGDGWADLTGEDWVLTSAAAGTLEEWDALTASARGGYLLPPDTTLEDRGPARRPLVRVSPIMSVNEDSPSPRPTLVTDSTRTRVVGWVRVVIGGRDVTWLRGTPVKIDSLDWEEPYGPVSASITLPQVSPLEPVGPRGMGLKGTGPLGWLRPGMDVDIDIVDARGRKITRVWEGFVLSMSEKATGSDVSVTVEAQGALWQADHVLKQPDLNPEREDIGTLIAQALNRVPGRRYKRIARKATGIEVFERGEWQPILSGWIGGLLADSTTDNTRDMWTVVMDPGRQPRLVKKSRTGRAWRITMGAPGVDISIDRDLAERATQIYGQGTDRRGDGWGNLKLPALQTESVEWPFSSPTATMSIGMGDGWTRNGRGVTELQERLVQCGYPTPVTGTYSAKTAAAVSDAQQDLGVPVTGVVNAQTWVAIMDPGAVANGGKSALDTAFYAPLATANQTEPFLYKSSGAIKGPNPDFNPRHIRMERFHRYPEGIDKADAKRSARKELRRDLTGYRTGTITLETCPENGSRWAIRAGDWVKVNGWHGRWPGDGGTHNVLVMRVVKVTWLEDGTKVSLTVDEGLRDAQTLDAVMDRERVAQTVVRRRAAVRKPTMRPPVDSELVGVVPRIPLTAGTWTVIRVPLGFDTTIARIKLTTKRDASPFAVAFFANRITPARLARLVPDPLTMNEDAPEPFPGNDDTAEALRALGWIDTIGTPGQAAGYWPGREDAEDQVTGKLVDDAGLYVESLRPPWVWLAFYAPTSCFIEGKLQPAPVGW